MKPIRFTLLFLTFCFLLAACGSEGEDRLRTNSAMQAEMDERAGTGGPFIFPYEQPDPCAKRHTSVYIQHHDGHSTMCGRCALPLTDPEPHEFTVFAEYNGFMVIGGKLYVSSQLLCPVCKFMTRTFVPMEPLLPPPEPQKVER